MIDRIRILRVVTLTLWAVLLLVGVASLLLIPLLVTINSRFAIANSQIAQLEKEGIVVSSINIATLETRAKNLSEKLAKPLSPAPIEYIGIVRSVVTTGITLSGFAMEKIETETPSLEVAGTTASREALQRFISALEAEEKISAVESPVSNYVKSTNSAFSITVSFK